MGFLVGRPWPGGGGGLGLGGALAGPWSGVIGRRSSMVLARGLAPERTALRHLCDLRGARGALRGFVVGAVVIVIITILVVAKSTR